MTITEWFFFAEALHVQEAANDSLSASYARHVSNCEI